MQETEKKYMARCLELAINGLGFTSPNPLVGCVIVHNDTIIGEGYHKKYGDAHAEVNAIEDVQDNSLLVDSTLYVNLEPCSHRGKTPPCTDLILAHKISRVVIGIIDPNSLVAGKGIEKLVKHGCQVTQGIMLQECMELNRRFFTFHKKKRPYIILKWAQTRDGFIDLNRSADMPVKPNWITGEISRMLVHKWRTEEQAILVGTNTAAKDNPQLNVRDWYGNYPLRLVIDRKLKLSRQLQLFDGTTKTVVFSEIQGKNGKNVEFHVVKFDHNLIHTILTILYDMEVTSLIVEGGKQLLDSFIEQSMWDEIRVFVGSKEFFNGVGAPVLNIPVYQEAKIGDDTLLFYRQFSE